jgi:hypothetical protein
MGYLNKLAVEVSGVRHSTEDNALVSGKYIIRPSDLDPKVILRMNEMMEKIIEIALKILGSSWKTSVFGFLSGLATVIYPILVAGRMPNGREWLIAIIIAGGFRLTKDSNVSHSSAPISEAREVHVGNSTTTPLTSTHGGGA